MPTTTARSHPLQPYWNLAAAPVQVQALELALELALFDQLETSTTATAIASAHRLRPDGCEAWLDLLWGMGLLERSARGYAASAVAWDWFRRDAPHGCVEAWRYRAGAFDAVAPRLGLMLRDEAGAGGASTLPTIGNWATAAQAQIGQEQRAITVPEALQVLDQLGLPRPGSCLLDLGGGPGLVAIALAQRDPSLTGVVFDLPQPVAVAADNIARAGLGQRLSVRAGNLDSDDIGSDYDVVWCSSVIHFVSEPAAMLARVLGALRPGGRLVITHAERPASAEGSLAVLPFYLPMHLRGSHVPLAGDTLRMLREAGFDDVRQHGTAQMAMAALPVFSGVRGNPASARHVARIRRAQRAASGSSE